MRLQLQGPAARRGAVTAAGGVAPGLFSEPRAPLLWGPQRRRQQLRSPRQRLRPLPVAASVAAPWRVSAAASSVSAGQRGPARAARAAHKRRALTQAAPSPAQPALPQAAAGEQPAPASLAGYDDDVLLEFRDVHKSFGPKPILRGASFKIRRGEAVRAPGRRRQLRWAVALSARLRCGARGSAPSWSLSPSRQEAWRAHSMCLARCTQVGIIGSSGTGKSTTLRLAAGLLAPDKVRRQRGRQGRWGGGERP